MRWGQLGSDSILETVIICTKWSHFHNKYPPMSIDKDFSLKQQEKLGSGRILETINICSNRSDFFHEYQPMSIDKVNRTKITLNSTLLYRHKYVAMSSRWMSVDGSSFLRTQQSDHHQTDCEDETGGEYVRRPPLNNRSWPALNRKVLWFVLALMARLASTRPAAQDEKHGRLLGLLSNQNRRICRPLFLGDTFCFRNGFGGFNSGLGGFNSGFGGFNSGFGGGNFFGWTVTLNLHLLSTTMRRKLCFPIFDSMNESTITVIKNVPSMVSGERECKVAKI